MNAQRIDDFLLGIAEATNALISQKLEEGINIALRTLCTNLAISAASVYITHRNSQGELVSSLKYFNTKEEDEERIKHNQNIPFTSFTRLYKTLSAGRSFEVMVSDSEEGLKQHMEADKTKSIAMFPIMVNNGLWGALSLSDRLEEKRWSISEKSLLLSLANSIGAAIERELLQDNLEDLVRKRTAELEESKLRFELAVEGTQNGVWDWEPQKNKVFWSDKMYRNLGYQEEDLPDLAEGFYDLVHPDDKAEAKKRFDDYLERKIPYVMEFRLRKKNGDYHWFKSTCQAVWDENGHPVRVVGSHADIHARKVYTELLAQQEEKFRAVIREDPNPLFLIDRTGNILLHSNRSVEVFGYSSEELSQMKLEQLLPSDKREIHRMHMAEYFNRPHNRIMGRGQDFKGRKKNGRLFYVEVSLSPVSIEGETLVMAVITDVSEKRTAKLKLEESYRKINNLINNLPGIVYQCRNDQYWTMDYISPACEQITGYKQEEFYGSPSDITYAELILPEERAEVWEHVQESLSRKSTFRVTYRIRDKAGIQKWIWEQGVGVYDQDDDLISLEGCIFDITPIVKSQERINQAIYAAENKERARIANDLHDGVQQILGASSLNLKYLSDDVKELPPKFQDHYNKSLQYLEQGIRESRNIAHRLMPMEIEELGLDQAIQQLLDELKCNLGIEINYYNNLEDKLSREVELGLYRVVQEAFNNINKYSKATKVSIQLVSNDDGIQMMIEDNGVGFDKNKIDLYKQGFGLAGMKNRIIALSGQLSVDSRPGRGACIVAWLPKKPKHHG